MDLVAAAAAAASAGQMTQQQPQQQQQPHQPGHAHPQQVQRLQRKGHQYELLRQAKDLCDRQDYVDLTIYCEDGVVRAHQMLLATASPFLKLLFQTSPLYGNDEISLILPETKACLVQALVHFVYTGTVVSKEDHFYSLMKLVYALNINASIEAESTNAKPTTFSAPLVPYSMIESPSKRKLPFQQTQQQQQAPSLPPPITPALPTQPLMMPALPTQPNPPSVVLPTHPVPPSKMPKLSTSAAASTPGVASLPTAALPTQPVPQASVASRMPATIQLPTQPIPMQGMVNGNAVPKTEPAVGQPQSYIAVDPNTGISYKVELPNGPVDTTDPLAAIMNETGIFTEASGSQAQTMYTTNENGQVVYTTQAPPTITAGAITSAAPVSANAAAATATGTSSSSASATPASGRRKRKGGPVQNKENQIVADSVDDLPCAPDDDDLNTPYPCEHCNKTIKGRVMLQAHQYQEHYENPEMANMDLADKHACRVCLKLFTRNSDVKAHILRVHCGDRRYPCTMCGKRFKESTHLRKHLYTHTGERPHYCTLCNKGFQTSSDLKRHKRTRVHQERVEQISQSGGVVPPDEDDDDDAAADAEANNSAAWSEEAGSSQQPAPNASVTAVAPGTTTVTGTIAAAGQKDAVAQALLSSITQPVAPVGNTSGGSYTVAASVAPAAAGTSSSTIDMKALGGTTAWNNNTAAGASVASTATTSVAQAAATAGGSSSTLDLKAIGGGSTLDMNALINAAAASTAPAAPTATAVTPAPAVPIVAASATETLAAATPLVTAPAAVGSDPAAPVAKRTTSVDSPCLEEDRLTVVENDDSQDSEQTAQQQQPPQQQQPQQPGGKPATVT